MLVLIIFLVGARMALVNLHRFVPQAEVWLSQLLEQPVKMSRLSSLWDGWTLHMRFVDIDVLDQTTQDSMLKIDEARVAVDLIETVRRGQLFPGRLQIAGARLLITRREDGSFSAEGLKPGSGPSKRPARQTEQRDPLVTWLISHGRLDLRDATFVWDDQRSPKPPVELTSVDVNLRVDNGTHLLRGTADLPASYGRELQFDLSIHGDPFRHDWSGVVQLKASELVVASLPRRENPTRVLTGNIDVEVTSHWAGGSMTTSSAQVSLREVGLTKGSATTHFSRGSLAIEAQRITDGWQTQVELRGVETSNGLWPDSTAELVTRSFGDGKRKLSGVAEFMRIEDLTAVAFALAPENMEPDLYGLRPSGVLSNIAFEITTKGSELHETQIKASLHDLSVPARGHLPGFSGLSGSVVATPFRGEVQLDSPTFTAELPALFDKPLTGATTGSVAWVRRGTGFWFDTTGVSFSNQFVAARLHGSVHWPFQNLQPIVDLSIFAERAELTSLSEYAPINLLNPRLAGWMKRAFKAGTAREAELHYKGYGGDFPFEGAPEGFHGKAQLQDVELQFSQNWPQFLGLDANVTVEGRSLTIEPTSANIHDSTLHSGTASISDLSIDDPIVEVSGRFQSTLDNGLEFLEHGALKNRFGKLANRIDGEGPIVIDLQLEVPLTSDKRTAVGSITLNDASLLFTGTETEFSEVNGPIDFTAEGLSTEGLHAVYLDSPVVIKAGKHPSEQATTRVTLEGDADKAFIVRQLHAVNLFADPRDPPRVMSRISGATSWNATLDVPRRWGEEGAEARLTVRSDLRGLHFDLPQPFRKTHSKAIGFMIDTALSDRADQVVRIHYGKQTGGVLKLNKQPTGFELDRGAVVFGDRRPELPVNTGLHIGGQLDEFSVDGWIDVTRDPSPDEPRQPGLDNYPLLRVLQEVEVRANVVEFLGQPYRDTHVTVKRDGQTGWRGHIMSDAIEGTAFFPVPQSPPRPIQVDLSRLALHKVDNDSDKEIGDPGRLPPFKFSCRSFHYDDQSLGTIKFSASPNDEGLRIDSFLLLGDGYEASSQGAWQYNEEQGHRTHLVTNVHADELSALLDVLGYQGGSTGGATELSANLTWNDAPSNFALSGVEGVVHLRSNRGRLLNVDPGAAGRLFGSLMLTALPRRLKLDFSDVFGEGVEFDSIEGSFGLARGHAYTNNLRLESEATRIEIAGRTGLVTEDYDQIVTVAPKLASSLPLAPLWLIEKVLKKSIFDKAFAYRYTITGPWAKPQIERVIVETSATRRENP